MEKKYLVAAHADLAATLKENFEHLQEKFAQFLDDFQGRFYYLMCTSSRCTFTKSFLFYYFTMSSKEKSKAGSRRGDSIVPGPQHLDEDWKKVFM